ncbi:hypothetical protein THAOC_19974, partial [Thalassiosira oceanica]
MDIPRKRSAPCTAGRQTPYRTLSTSARADFFSLNHPASVIFGQDEDPEMIKHWIKTADAEWKSRTDANDGAAWGSAGRATPAGGGAATPPAPRPVSATITTAAGVSAALSSSYPQELERARPRAVAAGLILRDDGICKTAHAEAKAEDPVRPAADPRPPTGLVTMCTCNFCRVAQFGNNLLSKLGSAETLLKQRDEEIDALAQECENLKSELETAMARLSDATTDLSKQTAEIKKLVSARYDALSLRDKSSAMLASKEVLIDSFRVKTGCLEGEVSDLTSRLEESQSELSETRGQCAGLASKLRDTESLIAGKQAAIESLRLERDRAASALSRAEGQYTSLLAEHEARLGRELAAKIKAAALNGRAAARDRFREEAFRAAPSAFAAFQAAAAAGLIPRDGTCRPATTGAKAKDPSACPPLQAAAAIPPAAA